MLDIDDIADVVASAVSEATEPLRKEIAELRAREALIGERGPEGPAGKDADMDVVRGWVAEGVAAAVAEIEPPKGVEEKRDFSDQEFASRLSLMLGKSVEIGYCRDDQR